MKAARQRGGNIAERGNVLSRRHAVWATAIKPAATAQRKGAEQAVIADARCGCGSACERSERRFA